MPFAPGEGGRPGAPIRARMGSAPGEMKRVPSEAARTKAANRTRSPGRSGPDQVPAALDPAAPAGEPGPDGVVPEPRRTRRSRRAAARLLDHPAPTGADPLSAAEADDVAPHAEPPGPWPMLNNVRPLNEPTGGWNENPGPWPEPPAEFAAPPPAEFAAPHIDMAGPHTDMAGSHGEVRHDRPGSRRFRPTAGTPAPEELPSWSPEQPAPDFNQLRRFAAVEAEAGPADPTDIRPLNLAAPGADDPGEPADDGGDPELDIDQDLDRAADVEESEQSRAMALPGFGVPGPADGPVGDLSGPFDAVDGTSAFTGFFPDAVLKDADETHLVPVPESALTAPDWADQDDLRYADADRVEDWVRPEYQEEPPPAAGEYWTPVPTGSYGPGYGWPAPVERLPEVPPYPAASGFDVPEERPMPQWPPARPDDRVEVPRSWPRRGATGPGYRTPVERDRPVGLRAVPDPVEEPAAARGRFGDEAVYPPAGAPGRRRFGEPMPAEDDRVFLGDQGLVLAAMPEDEDGPRLLHDEAVVPAEEVAPGRSRSGRVPARRGPHTGEGPYAAREESLEGPIWSVPDLPEATMPDLTWAPAGPADTGGIRRGRRPAARTRRRRSAVTGEDATQALSPTDPAPADQPRSRPRPRPRPGPGPSETRSTVYVSRHAAEPS